jgi:hypothetical protein
MGFLWFAIWSSVSFFTYVEPSTIVNRDAWAVAFLYAGAAGFLICAALADFSVTKQVSQVANSLRDLGLQELEAKSKAKREAGQLTVSRHDLVDDLVGALTIEERCK